MAAQQVVMWFSGGGTSSVLHYDISENINCLLDGTKTILMINRSYADMLQTPEGGWVPHSTSSVVDVDNVDADAYPALVQFEHWEARMEPGDCMYIPQEWIHQVRSYGSRNLAVNVWFHRMDAFDTTDCIEHARHPDESARPLSAFERFDMEVLGDDIGQPLPAHMLHAIRSERGLSFDQLSSLIPTQRLSRRTLRGIFRLLDTNADAVLTEADLELPDSAYTEVSDMNGFDELAESMSENLDPTNSTAFRAVQGKLLRWFVLKRIGSITAGTVDADVPAARVNREL
eukprot:m.314533 g.314533  ORF g.314533 m.314533 type:complete len:287 (+) comp20267_c0_seq12:941-1801(+)